MNLSVIRFAAHTDRPIVLRLPTLRPAGALPKPTTKVTTLENGIRVASEESYGQVRAALVVCVYERNLDSSSSPVVKQHCPVTHLFFCDRRFLMFLHLSLLVRCMSHRSSMELAISWKALPSNLLRAEAVTSFIPCPLTMAFHCRQPTAVKLSPTVLTAFVGLFLLLWNYSRTRYGTL